MALCLLPYLMKESARKCGQDDDILILTATSGDTGKAAMEGFRDVPGIRIIVFYPDSGVSAVQKQQMVSQEGKNVKVCAVIGNFDDAQSGVKRIFESAPQVPGVSLSSANSINIGRLVPQVVYYFSAYFAAVRYGRIKMGEKLNFSVPTGNFGDILAAYYAKRMGLPVNKLICASNSNDVLTDFLRTGVYDRNRPFHTTMSPSMDILVSSNLERLLFDLSGQNDEEVRGYMAALVKDGRYEVSDAIKAELTAQYWGGCCGEEECLATVSAYWKNHGYLIDTHTAVAVNVMEQYRAASGDDTVTVVVSTASPYKFGDSVLAAIGEKPVENSLDRLDQMHALTGVEIPRRLAALRGKERRFDQVSEKMAMEDVVLEFLK